MDHRFSSCVHGEPGKSRIIQAERLDILRNALLHVPTGQLFYILAGHAAWRRIPLHHRSWRQGDPSAPAGPLFSACLASPFSLAFCFGSFMLGTTLFFIGILGCAISGGHICFDVIHIVTSAILFHGSSSGASIISVETEGCRIRTRLGCSLVQGWTDERMTGGTGSSSAFLFLKGIFAREVQQPTVCVPPAYSATSLKISHSNLLSVNENGMDGPKPIHAIVKFRIHST